MNETTTTATITWGEWEQGEPEAYCVIGSYLHNGTEQSILLAVSHDHAGEVCVANLTELQELTDDGGVWVDGDLAEAFIEHPDRPAFAAHRYNYHAAYAPAGEYSTFISWACGSDEHQVLFPLIIAEALAEKINEAASREWKATFTWE